MEMRTAMVADAWVQSRPVLTVADLAAFDPAAPPGGAKRRFCCPLPDAPCAGKPVDAAHRSLEVQTGSGLWRCYRCGAFGRLREFWPRRQSGRAAARRAFGLSTPPVLAPAGGGQAPIRGGRSSGGGSAEAGGADAGAGGASGSAPAAAPAPVDPRAAYAVALPIAAMAAARSYLAARGIPEAVAAAAGVRAATHWFGRPALLFPLRDRAGELVAVSGRYLDGRADPKARTGGTKGLALFATPGALACDPIVITEAPLDALSLAACGAPAVALCGTSWPEWLPGHCAFRRVALATDADPAGDTAAAHLAVPLWSFGARAERWRPDGGKDWNELLQSRGAAPLRAVLRAACAGPLVG